MTEHKISPDKVTKPIQLLAAWLVGLIVVNGSFLVAAQQISKPEWASAVLVVAAIANVPIFLFALFLLQTKFRPQMQEDSYYSQYLERERYQTNSSNQTNTSRFVEQEVVHTAERLVRHLGLEQSGKEKKIEEVLRKSQQEILLHKYGGSRTLSELFLDRENWNQVLEQYKEHRSLISDIEGMVADGLIVVSNDDYTTAKLSENGTEIAIKAKELNMLFAQRNVNFWTYRLRNSKNKQRTAN
ncbi:hypothetical protein [Janthinobacterium sp. GMG1]|uniref:hypothetical protein n=1 Tax=Janthinobacterium sp. GMG1 TaxID=3096007 RepID=UPI002ACAA767|nr:hypothetical protein [Janthinobacterium sp. GMG1]MDZ5635010.1 hypothetical protein [Janthinobacterium sp. GMG1]